MANQIQLSLALGLTTGNTTLVNWITGPLTFDQTGTRYSDVVQTINSTGVALSVPLGTLGFLAIVNLDTTTGSNPVYIYTASGLTTGLAIAKLYGGYPCVIPLGAAMSAPYAYVTGTTAVNVKTIVMEF